MEYSGAGGKLIHEKNQKQKISRHCPFKNVWDDPDSNDLWKVRQVLWKDEAEDAAVC